MACTVGRRPVGLFGLARLQRLPELLLSTLSNRARPVTLSRDGTARKMPDARCPLPPKFYDWCNLYDVEDIPGGAGQAGPAQIRVSIRDDGFGTRQHVISRVVAAHGLLNHPNIRRAIRGSGEYPCLVTTRANGGNLCRYLKNHPNADRRALVLAIAKVVLYLHTKTAEKMFVLVHGNLHPTTILIHDNHPLLSDFALCSVDPAPIDGVLCTAPVHEDGVVAYMAPELLQSGSRTTATDVYAFGMLLFEVFAGQPPVPVWTMATAVQVRGGKGVRLSRQAMSHGALGDDVWELVARCTALDPAARPAMAQVCATLYHITRLDEPPRPGHVCRVLGLITSIANLRMF